MMKNKLLTGIFLDSPGHGSSWSLSGLKRLLLGVIYGQEMYWVVGSNPTGGMAGLLYPCKDFN